jgi:hypothetical protein
MLSVGDEVMINGVAYAIEMDGDKPSLVRISDQPVMGERVYFSEAPAEVWDAFDGEVPWGIITHIYSDRVGVVCDPGECYFYAEFEIDGSSWEMQNRVRDVNFKREAWGFSC